MVRILTNQLQRFKTYSFNLMFLIYFENLDIYENNHLEFNLHILLMYLSIKPFLVI